MSTSTIIHKPTRKQYEIARETLRGDWDEEGTTSVHLPQLQAENVALALGFTWNNDRDCYERDGEVYWNLDSALQHALTALGTSV